MTGLRWGTARIAVGLRAPLIVSALVAVLILALPGCAAWNKMVAEAKRRACFPHAAFKDGQRNWPVPKHCAAHGYMNVLRFAHSEGRATREPYRAWIDAKVLMDSLDDEQLERNMGKRKPLSRWQAEDFDKRRDTARRQVDYLRKLLDRAESAAFKRIDAKKLRAGWRPPKPIEPPKSHPLFKKKNKRTLSQKH
ncbi:MAG: hypothetical protein AAGC70_02020 [Pseudomonadota bacterium]